MKLPDNFQFNQGNLQDFVDCKKRFYLKHIQKIAWPAVKTEPVLEYEMHQKRGQRFHQLIHQSQIGIPENVLEATIDDHELSQWWIHYQGSPLINLPGENYPEFTLNTSINGQRLTAKYDLINISEDQLITIFDWKTYQKKPARKWFANRLQTRVYSFVMVNAGLHLNQNNAVNSDQVNMMYWLSNYPENPEIFHYNENQFKEDQDYLSSLISMIESLQVDDFEMTSQEKLCGFCTYRSLCERGIKAHNLMELETAEDESDIEINIDFDQIAELEF